MQKDNYNKLVLLCKQLMYLLHEDWATTNYGMEILHGHDGGGSGSHYEFSITMCSMEKFGLSWPVLKFVKHYRPLVLYR